MWSVAWAHPRFGSILASCSYDKQIKIWTGQGSSSFQEAQRVAFDSKAIIHSIEWGPHEYGLRLAACSSDGQIMVVQKKKADDTFGGDKIVWQAHQLGINALSWKPFSSIYERVYILYFRYIYFFNNFDSFFNWINWLIDWIRIREPYWDWRARPPIEMWKSGSIMKIIIILFKLRNYLKIKRIIKLAILNGSGTSRGAQVLGNMI